MYDDLDDDEDWYDDDSELDDEDTGRCPECGADVHSIAERCPACGYWLSEADRRAIWSTAARPAWLKATAWIVLLAFLLTVVGLAAVLY